MKFENQRYKFLLSEMMEKFMKFKLSYEKGKGMGVTGESGSSFVWKDRADPSNTKIRHRENSVNDPDMVNFEMENEKDHIIKKLKQKLSQFLLSEMMEKFIKFKQSYEKGKGMGATGESG
eukprot:CAMPEP_0205803472 /NCGR_PEP_ID=MMETSP0205-20121125/6133_1 /ASSEMBLY_ACC=CAM_ASM_000278 /TAXON_ID=36767 /ORGANISM="Euplotes focardii, Strain TN1" /LENGTH=119 /DNA_ID=CAMNT_0053071599 /DNA_START=1303 /DNA_END=1659 /DNA_ORIENTATION=+